MAKKKKLDPRKEQVAVKKTVVDNKNIEAASACGAKRAAFLAKHASLAACSAKQAVIAARAACAAKHAVHAACAAKHAEIAARAACIARSAACAVKFSACATKYWMRRKF